jgi:hypothetical protein
VNHDPISRVLRREQLRAWIAPAVLVVVGAPFVIYGVWYEVGRPGRDGWQPIAIGLVAIAIGVMLARRSSIAPLARRLIERPADVVWIFERAAATSHELCFGFADGSIAVLAIRTPLVEDPQLRGTLAAQFPHARRGLSAELAAAFARDPQRFHLEAQP